MAITCLSFEEAYDAVKGARNCVNVNCSFRMQLKRFECTQIPQVFFLNLIYTVDNIRI